MTLTPGTPCTHRAYGPGTIVDLVPALLPSLSPSKARVRFDHGKVVLPVWIEDLRPAAEARSVRARTVAPVNEDGPRVA